MRPLVTCASTWCRWARYYQTSCAHRRLFTSRVWKVTAGRRCTGTSLFYGDMSALTIRTLATSTSLLKKSRKGQEDILQEETTKNVILLGPDEEDLGTMTLSEAEARAHQDNYKLVLVEDHKANPVYQLMTGKQFIEEQKRSRDLKKATKKKEEKTLRLTSKITDHDLSIKTKHTKQWLEKGHQVKVHVKNDNRQNNQGMTRVMKHICDEVASTTTVHEAKRTAGELVFHLKPKDLEAKKREDPIAPIKHEVLKKERVQGQTSDNKS